MIPRDSNENLALAAKRMDNLATALAMSVSPGDERRFKIAAQIATRAAEELRRLIAANPADPKPELRVITKPTLAFIRK